MVFIENGNLLNNDYVGVWGHVYGTMKRKHDKVFPFKLSFFLAYQNNELQALQLLW